LKTIAQKLFKFCIRHVCGLALAICLFLSWQYQSKEYNFSRVIKGDGIGYYSYLPAVFIYNDYQYAFLEPIDKKYDGINLGTGFLNKSGNGVANKYFIGLSILWLPFFLIAHFLALIFGFDPDGFSTVYHVSILIAANFYTWLGLRFTRKIILELGASEIASAGILLLTVFGANLCFYTTNFSSYTHAYSFMAIAGFLHYSNRFFKNKSPNHLYFSALFFAMIILLRPTNAVIGLMALFWAGSFKSFFETLWQEKKSLLIASGVFVLTLLPQFILYYLQTGHLIVWSYGNETFNFTNPQIFKVLFSYEKGLFVYAPLTLFSLAGLIYLYKKNKFQFAVFSLLLILTTYIISSWWCWTYGTCLGQRAFVDFYAVLSMLVTYLYLGFKKGWHKKLFYVVSAVCVLFSGLITYQYQHDIIDGNGMNKSQFWFTFLKTGDDYRSIYCAYELFNDKDPVNIIWIRASNNKYLSSDRDARSSLRAAAEKPQLWETFNMIPQEKNKIAIKADDGNYISVRLDDANMLSHVAKEAQAWEKFDLVEVENGYSVLKACNNKYVTLKDGNLIAGEDNIQKAERLLILRK